MCERVSACVPSGLESACIFDFLPPSAENGSMTDELKRWCLTDMLNCVRNCYRP